MNLPFDAAMRQALALARAQDPAAATMAIQRALDIRPTGASPHREGRTRVDQPSTPEDVSSGIVIDHDPHDPTSSSGSKIRVPAARPSAVRGDAGRAEWQKRVKRPLGEVISMLASARARAQRFDGFPVGKQTRTADPLPDGAKFLTRSYASEAGSRSYKLYIPASMSDRPEGLVVMLHGCKQDPDDFARGTRMNDLAETYRLVVAYPAQTGSANAASCWNWFNPGHQRRDHGEPAIIAGITREIAAEFGVGRTRTFVAGLSAGGAMAAIMADAYPDLFAAVGVHSGLAVGSANDVVSAFAAMRGSGTVSMMPGQIHAPGAGVSIRTIIFHGTGDTTVHPSNAEQLAVAATRSSNGLAFKEEHIRDNGRDVVRKCWRDVAGLPQVESWSVAGASHAWFGGNPAGSYADRTGPDAATEMIRFFFEAA